MNIDTPIPCPDPLFKIPYFPLAKVVIKEPHAFVPDPVGAPNVIHALRHCGILTVNGQLWLITLDAFNASEELLRNLWETTPSLFFRHSSLAE